MGAHTPTPWSLDSRFKAVVVSEKGDQIAAAFSDATETSDERDANAAFIVRACNGFELLVKALERAKIDLDAAAIIIEDARRETAYGLRQTLEIVDAALAQVKQP